MSRGFGQLFYRTLFQNIQTVISDAVTIVEKSVEIAEINFLCNAASRFLALFRAFVEKFRVDRFFDYEVLNTLYREKNNRQNAHNYAIFLEV